MPLFGSTSADIHVPEERNQFFQQDILKLEVPIDRDLPDWFKPRGAPQMPVAAVGGAALIHSATAQRYH